MTAEEPNKDESAAAESTDHLAAAAAAAESEPNDEPHMDDEPEPEPEQQCGQQNVPSDLDVPGTVVGLISPINGHSNQHFHRQLANF